MYKRNFKKKEGGQKANDKVVTDLRALRKKGGGTQKSGKVQGLAVWDHPEGRSEGEGKEKDWLTVPIESN